MSVRVSCRRYQARSGELWVHERELLEGAGWEHCVRDIAAGKGSMSSMRPGEILGLYVMSLQRPPSPQGHHDACAGLAALFPTTAAPGFH